MLIVILGAGVVGLWSAIKLREKGYDVTVIDRCKTAGESTSRRNSGVLHAGIYYENESKKAYHCVRGYDETVEFISESNVYHAICGKMIIPTVDTRNANSEYSDLDQLEMLYEKAKSNSVEGIELVKLKKKFSYINSSHALLSPKTGVVDIDDYINKLYARCISQGIEFKFLTRFVSCDGDQLELVDLKTNRKFVFRADFVINSCGLYADDVAREYGVDGYTIKPNKGVFYRLSKPLPQHILVYPLPFTNSSHLGCHYTVDVANNAYIGPDATWASSKEDYVLAGDRAYFFASLKGLTNFYKEEDLLECVKVGLRPRLFYKNEPVLDFLIIKSHPNILHLLGIESPGLTSAPSLANEICALIEEK